MKGCLQRTVSVNGRRRSKKKVVMRISLETFERLKENSSRYGDTESYDEMLVRLMNFYELEKEKCLSRIKIKFCIIN
jgi:ASC-1-like (ASCH) protein